MPKQLVITVELLAGSFHGTTSPGVPEWPPSPFRVFQALLAGAARLGGGQPSEPTLAALRRLERLSAPVIYAPRVAAGAPRRSAVPNNDYDAFARSAARGTTVVDPKSLNTLKTTRTVHVLSRPLVRYVWSCDLSEPVAREWLDELGRIASAVSAVGWGQDLAIVRVPTQEEGGGAFEGEEWAPAASGVILRVAREGSTADLQRRHGEFMRRLAGGAYTMPTPVAVFDVVAYRRVFDPAPRPVAAFAMVRDDASGLRAFDPTRRGLTVAGLARHAVKRAADRAGWTKEQVARTVLGHGQGDTRFAFLPVPSIEYRGGDRTAVVGAIRRLMVTATGHESADAVAWARRAVSGQDLVDEHTGEAVALLSLLPNSDRMLRHYLRAASSWSTVLPVVLPGFDDPAHHRRRLDAGVDATTQRKLLAALDARTDGLLRKSIVHAGYSEALARHAAIEWRFGGFLPGVDLSGRYGVPDHLKRFPRLHVRITWRDAEGRSIEVPGPVCIGAGRFYGLGLFAADV